MLAVKPSRVGLYLIKRWSVAITPHSLIATDQRLIKSKPTRLGLTASIEDYNYVDIANVRIEEGLFFSTVAMKERFQGDDMAFPNIPKRAGEGFVRIAVSYTHLRAHETRHDIVCRL